MACQYLIIGIDHGDLYQIELFDALFQILDLLRAHDPRVLIIRDELGDHALLSMPS